VSLKEWVQKGWLHPHKTSPKEIEDLFAIADRDLKDCQTSGLSNDWRLNIAYNAALQISKVALAATGYRTSHEAHHYRLIHSLAFTIEADIEFIGEFDAFRKKRNISDYERAGLVADHEVEEVIELANDLRKQVVQWLRKSHSHLLDTRP
jgi:hypothetical protein